MKKLKLFLIASLVSTGIMAQDNFFGITYNTALTTGETKEFIEDYSWGALGLEWKKMVTDNASYGINFSWQVMSQKIDHGVIDIPESTITLSGTQLRYLNFFPITVTGSYHFNPEGNIIPFVGIGAGPYRVLQRFDISGYVFQEDTWNFGFYPEVGVLIPTGGSADFFINSKYHYILKANDGPTHTYLNINVGFSYFY